MTKKQKKNLLCIIVSILLFVMGQVLGEKNLFGLIFLFLSYIIIGHDVLIKAFKNLRKAHILDENFLMAIATVGAIAIKEYPEAVFVMIFYKVGELFESIAVGKSRKSISQLADMRPDYANLFKDGKKVVVSPEEVRVGDIIIIEPGDKIPLDCVVKKGNSYIDVSALTGESVPLFAGENTELMSGAINADGVLTAEVTKEFYDSTVSKILELVENSASNKAKSEDFITHFAKYYTPTVVALAVIVGFIPPIFVGDFSSWFQRALIFLVVSCPCAVVISVPLTFFASIGKASRQGILIKGSNYVEALSKVGTVVFDKTGTLTEGEFFVSKIKSEKIPKDELIKIGALCELHSKHPIAVSLKKEYKGEIDEREVENVKEIAGCGVSAEIGSEIYFCGNKKLMETQNISIKEENTVGTVVYISKKEEYLGCIIIEDKMKKEAQKAVSFLKNAGVKHIVMLTGDKKAVAEKVAEELLIDECHSELLPQDKVSIIEEIMCKYKNDGKTVFVGDGINDAPVLMRADIGISMGGVGSDAAIEASDIVIMDDRISKIHTAILLSNKTNKIVWQNIIFSLFIKFAVLILSVGGYTNMWIASFSDVGVAVIAILNALRMFL